MHARAPLSGSYCSNIAMLFWAVLHQVLPLLYLLKISFNLQCRVIFAMVSTWTNDMSALNICSPMDNVTLLFLLRASCLKNHSIDHLFLERIYSGYR